MRDSPYKHASPLGHLMISVGLVVVNCPSFLPSSGLHLRPALQVGAFSSEGAQEAKGEGRAALLSVDHRHSSSVLSVSEVQMVQIFT